MVEVLGFAESYKGDKLKRITLPNGDVLLAVVNPGKPARAIVNGQLVEIDAKKTGVDGLVNKTMTNAEHQAKWRSRNRFLANQRARDSMRRLRAQRKERMSA